MDVGAQLRQAREARGLTIEAISRSTRVQQRILSAIEQNDTVSLPPRPYGRGFVRTYASEVGLDPELTVREFFSQFAPVPEPSPGPETHRRQSRPDRSTPRGWMWTTALVLAYALVGALVIAAGRWAMQPDGERGAVGTAGRLAPPTPAVGPETARTPTAVQAAAAASVVRVNLEAQRAVWITAVVDGDRAVYRTLQPGERVGLNGTREITIRAGDAGAVLWQVNGGAAAPMGRPGEVRTERVTIDAHPR